MELSCREYIGSGLGDGCGSGLVTFVLWNLV